MTKKKIGAKEGRPTIVTPEVVAKLENAFAQGFTDTDACILAEISRDCLYDYIKRVPSFATKRDALRRRPLLSSVLLINKAIKEGDVATAKWYAERKAKDEFSLKTEATIDASVTTRIIRDDI